MARKGEFKIIAENYLQRYCTTWLFFKSYVKEYASLLLYENGSTVLEFRADQNDYVKYRYEMESCVGVYLRVEMDHARANWPTDINPECCFTLINQREDKILYLIAENSKIAQNWTWKLSQYIKVPQNARKPFSEEFSVNNLIDVYNLLIAEPSLLSSEPSSWKFLGRNLGLADSTLQKIEDFYDTKEDRLYNCLSKWIRRCDQVDEKGGPTCYKLVDALRKINNEEIAERVFAKFNNKNGEEKGTSIKEDGEEGKNLLTEKEPQGESGDACLPAPGLEDTAVHPKPKSQQLLEETEESFKDEERQEIRQSQTEDERKRTWTLAGHGDKTYEQALANCQKDSKLRMLMEAVTYKMQNSKMSFLAEIKFLSNTKMSSLVTINNETPHTMMYHQCFIARGRISGYPGFNESIAANSHKSYSFEKYSSLSLDGCAAMILLSATTCESTKCYFAVAFRNYLKFASLSRNKAALLILNDAESIVRMSDSQCFSKIMRNKDESPNFEGCYKGDIYKPSFMLASLDQSECHEFRNICFRIAMIDGTRSQISLTVLHPEPIG
ncbi:PREDICTED: uncharacterized protein LOC109589540 isoform X2 [Amphimedon queenslandica]|uniref:Death domain-containing protein n=1 Tax=Amphimedon queenslandica TaxID=400682 RepID=A0AAN0JW65_AMPQE|nr:PREDICTED: uncharacterized protein LOC109589540 isoform X2 [Amphimedon queenslandica]|eukprot:XP_019861161.1 PREDICTED: uncharacterized protein LOC109589540 isoform X2 [Amphimedon queenslandica]